MACRLPAFKLERYFDKYEHHVKHILCASDAQPWTVQQVLDLAPTDPIDLLSLRLAYTHAQGCPALRQAIADLHNHTTTSSSSSPVLTADHVLVVAPSEGILLTMMARCHPGDEVVATYPGYQSLYQLAVSRGCSVRHWEPEADGHTFDLAALEALVTPSTSLVVVNFPHNPTGATLTAEQLQRLAQICHAANAMLFSDEMYLFLPHDPAQQLPTAALLSPQAVCLSGMSKCFGMPGIRLGWLVSQDVAFIRAAAQLKDYSTICTAGPSEWLALQGLRNAAAVVDAERRIVLRNLQLLEDFFNRWQGVFEWQPPKHGTVAFPRLTTGEPVEAFCDRCVQQAGVLLLPATVYDHEPSTAQGRFRIGIGRDDLSACLAALEAYLQQHPSPA